MTFLKSSCSALIKDAWKSVRLRSTTYLMYAQYAFPEGSALGCGEQCIWKISMNKEAESHPFHAKCWEFWRRAVLAVSTFPSCCLGCSFNVDKVCVCVHMCCYSGTWLMVGDRQMSRYKSLTSCWIWNSENFQKFSLQDLKRDSRIWGHFDWSLSRSLAEHTCLIKVVLLVYIGWHSLEPGD